MANMEDDLNVGLKNYCLQIMGCQYSTDDYNTEASVQYLEENTVLEDEELHSDLEKLEENGFLETEEVSEEESYETDYLLEDTKVSITEEGQDFIEDKSWDKLADSARNVRFTRTEIIEG